MTSSPGTTSAKHRVVHVGTGMTGSVALRAIIDDPALDLVGLKVSSPTKVGTDAGSLCGRPDVGIAATDDLAAVLDAKPDCIAYCATAVRREDEVIADIVGYLEAGINVVTISAIPMVYPRAAPANWREPIENAARQRQLDLLRDRMRARIRQPESAHRPAGRCRRNRLLSYGRVRPRPRLGLPNLGSPARVDGLRKA